MAKDSRNYVVRIYDDPGRIDPGAWDALAARSPQVNPFVAHDYLVALHKSRSAIAATGWTPRFVTVWFGNELLAASAAYLKNHSYGEYVFDWAWADAYERHGLSYYPKLLCALPFTPVPGPRLMARDAASRQLLLGALEALARNEGLSSVHILFLDCEDLVAVRAQGWMLRSTVQFHWTNRQPTPYSDFEDFLANLQRDKRKKIRQERRHVAEASIVFSALRGADIHRSDWDFFYECYCNTYRAHQSRPYLTRDFFNHTAKRMADNWVLFVARRHDKRIASALVAIDDLHRRAYGRYWGCIEHVPLLHFEACYYQPLQWCIENRYLAFEGGAQGEHKMARGLLPERTWSAHWLLHPSFAGAVAQYLAREAKGLGAYVSELEDRNPFKVLEDDSN